MTVRLTVWLFFVGIGCTAGTPAPAPRVSRDAGATPSPGERPPMPSPATTADAGASACIPRNFRTSRVRVVGAFIELCGIVPAVGGRCFNVDPLAQHVEALPGRDGPATMADLPVFEEPVQQLEASAHGARASLRGGTLTVTGPGGQSRTVIPRAVAFASLDNAAVLPWAGGRQFALVGWRAPDLGAMTLIDPVTLRMQGKAAELPCP